jgi:hypothetical protein
VTLQPIIVKAKGRFGTLFLFAGLALLLSTCALPGPIYGKLMWVGTPTSFAYIDGFPTLDKVVQNTQYQVQPGTYFYSISLHDGGHYYPGFDSLPVSIDDPSIVYQGTYKVEAAPPDGIFNGPEHDFTLWLGHDGLSLGGDVTAMSLVSGAKSFTTNGVRITITKSIITSASPPAAR